MDIGDITDPNLDGDFQTLVEVRQKRSNNTNNETAIKQLLSLNEIVRPITSRNGDKASQLTDALDALKTNKSGADVNFGALRTLLMEAVEMDDVSAMTAACKRVSDAALRLTDGGVRDQLNDATIFHTALVRNKWEVGRYLIQSNKDDRLIDDVFTVTVKKLTSKKTSLHILAEKGQYELTKLLLDQLTNSVRRKALVDAVVLTELEGQRPRHLASIHLASLHGHTELVQLFLDMGVDVNARNNKNDTPVLWAARGNNLDTVRLLISRGANLQIENDKGSTPLYWATRYGFAELVRLLVVEGNADVHQRRKLGLVTPIVLASALGFPDIVEILLDYGADVEARIANGTTALQAAAFEGNNDVIEVLLTKGQAKVDQTDTAGNTALLCAARVGNVASMNALVAHGASIDAQNKLGETVWHFAVRDHNDTMLSAIAGLYKKVKNIGAKIITFDDGRNPLQVAVAAGRVDKIRCLLQVGADPKATDLNGNTFYHLAARDGREEIVQAFIDEVDLASVNNDGDTALHLAAISGHTDVVKLLISKSKLDVRNKQGMTPLMMAVSSDFAHPQMIRMMIDVILAVNTFSLVDAVDNTGNTALHLAARRGYSEILPEMATLNARTRNNDGDTPFHVAARSGLPHIVETMLEVFNRPEKGFNVDEMTSVDGQSALHICAERGDWQRVEVLAAVGADLSLQDLRGNTALHVIVEESVREPRKMESFLQVIRAVVRCATRWWCMINDRQHPPNESELYYAEMRAAVVHLTSDLFNVDGLSVVALATVLGSVPIVEEILNTPHVYRFHERDSILFDITYLTPSTLTTTTPFNRSTPSTATHSVFSKSRSFPNGKKLSAVVGVIDEAFVNAKSGVATGGAVVAESASAVVGPLEKSCLEMIASMPDKILAARMLEVAPYRQLARNQWSAYQWIYGVLMVIHIFYMALYTAFALPNSRALLSVYNVTLSVNQCPSLSSSSTAYGIFLLWPMILVVFIVFFSVAEFVRYLMKSRCFSSLNCRHPWSQATFNLFDILALIFEPLSQLSGILFGALTIYWYVLYRCGTTTQAYVQITALVLIVGWLFTLNFIKGFETMHAFAVMVMFIIIRDITRFILLYIFILLAFGLAFHTLFQLSPTISGESGTWLNTLVNVFNLMLGLGSPIDSSFDSTYTADGGNSAFVYAVYIIYIGLASIILMTLLVAMMSDTYSSIKTSEGTTWKVNSLQLGLGIERSMPLVKNFLRCSGRDPILYDTERGRWMLSVPKTSVVSRFGELLPKDETIDVMLKVVQRLEAKIDQVQAAHEELVASVDAVNYAIRRKDDDETVTSVGLSLHKPASKFFKVAMAMRKRPKSATKEAK